MTGSVSSKRKLIGGRTELHLAQVPGGVHGELAFVSQDWLVKWHCLWPEIFFFMFINIAHYSPPRSPKL